MDSGPPGLSPWERDAAMMVMRLSSAVHRYRTIIAHDRYGMDTSAGMALVALGLHGPMSPSQIGALLNLTPPATTELLDRLDRAGYITRHPHPTDRRKILVTTSPTGHDLANWEWSDFARLLSPVLSAHGESARQHTITTIADMVHTVEQFNTGLAARLASGPPPSRAAAESATELHENPTEDNDRQD
jgi:DNA-binding MarR family transcriptional regulator